MCICGHAKIDHHETLSVCFECSCQLFIPEETKNPLEIYDNGGNVRNGTGGYELDDYEDIT